MKAANIKKKCMKKWLDEKRNQDIQKKLRDFPNNTLAGFDSAIVAMKHLIHILRQVKFVI